MQDSKKTSSAESAPTGQPPTPTKGPSRRMSLSEFADALKRDEINLDVPMKLRKRKKD
jgi:hypothetical protein